MARPEDDKYHHVALDVTPVTGEVLQGLDQLNLGQVELDFNLKVHLSEEWLQVLPVTSWADPLITDVILVPKIKAQSAPHTTR